MKKTVKVGHGFELELEWFKRDIGKCLIIRVNENGKRTSSHIHWNRNRMGD